MRFLLLVTIFFLSFSSSLYAQDLSNTVKVERPSFFQEIWKLYSQKIEKMIPKQIQQPAPESNNVQQPSSESPTQKDEATKDENLSQYEQEVVNLVNEERKKQGLKPLTVHVKLSELARKKSADMKEKNYFSHQSPTYGSPCDMVSNHGISYRSCGENIAAGYQTAKQVVQGWMNSQEHRKNILNPNYTHIGVGYVEGGSYGTYWTQLFIGQ